MGGVGVRVGLGGDNATCFPTSIKKVIFFIFKELIQTFNQPKMRESESIFTKLKFTRNSNFKLHNLELFLTSQHHKVGF